ncbi:MAG: four helix bundle protein [Candidatus Cloacimonetes bacterium]|nr:four helix bundle protein [Candidatus Cloacimonadota bacterium]
MSKERKFDLQDRLIDYAVRIINLSEALPNTKTGNHIHSQILKSGTSPAPNYGEAQSAESTADFIHKMKIALKELRETDVWLKIIMRAKLITPKEKLSPLLTETDELISIFVKSIETARKNDEKNKK